MSANIAATPTAESARAEAIAYLDVYRTYLEGLDAAKVAACYHAPTMSVSATTQTPYGAAEELLSNFQVVMGQFRAIGLHRCEYQLGQVRSHGSDLFDWEVDWSATNREGTLLKVLRNVYVMRRVDGELKIVAVILRD